MLPLRHSLSAHHGGLDVSEHVTLRPETSFTSPCAAMVRNDWGRDTPPCPRGQRGMLQEFQKSGSPKLGQLLFYPDDEAMLYLSSFFHKALLVTYVYLVPNCTHQHGKSSCKHYGIELFIVHFDAHGRQFEIHSL